MVAIEAQRQGVHRKEDDVFVVLGFLLDLLAHHLAHVSTDKHIHAAICWPDCVLLCL